MTPERERYLRDRIRLYDERPDYRDPIDGQADIRELFEEIDGLREFLRIYGGHCGSCKPGQYIYEEDRLVGKQEECTCGFRQVWSEQVERKKDYRSVSRGPEGVGDGKGPRYRT